MRVGFVALALALPFSGCAALKSSKTVRPHPEDPAAEIVTVTRCRPVTYPGEMTGEQYRNAVRLCLEKQKEEGRGESPVSCRVANGWAHGLTGLVLEPVFLPFTLWAALFSSECATDTTYREAPAREKQRRRREALLASGEGRPPRLTVGEVSFKDPGSRGVLQGGDTSVVAFTIRNDRNAGPALELKASLSGPAGIREVMTIGDVAPDERRDVRVALTAPNHLPDGETELRLSFEEKNGNVPDPVHLRVTARSLKPPRFKITRVELDDRPYRKDDADHLAFGDGDGAWQAGETVELHLTVTNEGGPADEVTAQLLSGAAPSLTVLEGARFTRHAAVGAMDQSAAARLTFAVSLSRVYAGPEQLPLTLRIGERRERFSVSLPVGLRAGARVARPVVVEVKPRGEQPAAAAADDVNLPPRARTPMDPDAVAVVIGVEKYRAGLPRVDYAALDAQAVHAYLTRAMGFDAANVAVLTDEQATKGDLEKHLEVWLANRVTAKSRVFVYYAGHGSPNPKTGEPYLMPYDADPNYADVTGYPLRRLYKTLAALPAKNVTVALDACFSGAGGRSVLAKGTRPLLASPPQLDVGSSIVVLAAARADQISASDPAAQHGLLTYFMLKGLRGAADGDTDGRVTTSELFDYVRPQVERAARLQNVEQVPTLTPANLGRRAHDSWIVLARP